MFLRGVRVGQLKPDDVARLVHDGVQESRILEYKEQMKFGTDAERKEFLADVSSFANTNGGVILYGVEEARDDKNGQTGRPIGFSGFDASAGLDQIQATIESRVADGLAPRLMGLSFQLIEVNGDKVLALGVPSSLTAPHMIWFGQSGKFFRRRESGKYQVDVHELRALFLERDEWERGGEEFREKRLRLIESRRVDPTFPVDRFTAIHILPLGRLREVHDVFRNSGQAVAEIAPRDIELTTGGSQVRGTLVGPRITYQLADGTQSYAILFRNGGIEFASARYHGTTPAGVNVFLLGWLSRVIPDFAAHYVKYAGREFGIDPPFAISVSIFGASHLPVVEFSSPFDMLTPLPTPFGASPLIVPALIIEQEDEAQIAGKELVRMLRQAAGAF